MNALVLAKQRAHIERRQMPDLCDFYQIAEAGLDDRGEASVDPDEVVLSGVACRVGSTQQTSSESEAGGQTRAKQKINVFVPADTERPDNAGYVIVTTQNDRRIEITDSVWVSEGQVLKIEGVEDR